MKKRMKIAESTK